MSNTVGIMNYLNKKSVQIVTYAIITSAVFYLGIIFYTSLNQQTALIVQVKEHRPDLEKKIWSDLKISTGGETLSIQSKETEKWLETYIRSYSGKEDLRISYAKITDYLESLAPHLNTEPVNAKLKFDNDRASIFVPPSPGQRLNIPLSTGLIAEALIDHKPSISLAFDFIEPEITLEKINDLGIKTLLGRGESDYGKSPASRIHNIKIGMAKFNGIILGSGEKFSFNNFLGTVDERDGYQAELVIKGGELVREYGGGLCQVSTTVFRAAIMSGLSIVERRPHSFPVQYYNPQGFDSTVYPGVVDLKFSNNTSNHILIQTKVTGSKLSVEVYGSSDGRKVEIEGPIQYEKEQNGAMKAYFIRKIYRNGQLTEEERFGSNYKAPPIHPLERNPLE